MVCGLLQRILTTNRHVLSIIDVGAIMVQIIVYMKKQLSGGFIRKSTVPHTRNKHIYRKQSPLIHHLLNTTYIYLHFPIQAIVKEQVVCHSNSMRFHGMSLPIIVVTYVTCIICI